MATRKRSGFLANYAVDATYLLKPARSEGRAGIFKASDAQSRNLLIKVWPRAKASDDGDLEEIWRSEIRQLHRLMAVPKADDLLVSMVTSGKDGEGFYLVLEAGQGAPLERFLQTTRKVELFAQARQPRYRRLLWANARRLAQGLDLLHSQGIIHRNLDPWAVITAGGDEPDFRLTGFEWSMRIVSAAARKEKRIQAPRIENSFSFSRDWRDLALLFALFLDLPSAPLGDLKIIPSRVAEHASASEVRLLRMMLGLEKVDRLDGEFVCSRIDEIINSISAEAAGREARLCLAARLGNGSDLAASIRRASENEIETSDELQQLRFMEDDLGSRPNLVSVREGDNPLRYVLVGNKLTYRISAYRSPGSTTDAANWEFAYCERASNDAPHVATIAGETFIDSGMLEIVRNGDATGSFPRRRGKVQHWNSVLGKTADVKERKTELEAMHQSFSLLLLLEMAYAAANIFPVEIVSKRPDDASDSHLIHLVSRSDGDRAELSKLLGLEAPAVRLAKALDGDDVREEGAWSLSEPGMLGERSSSITSWRFAGTEELDSLECYKFEGSVPPAGPAVGFLIPAGMQGNIAQFKRRLKALSALSQHRELLRMLADPRQRIDHSQDPLDEKSESFKELDPSKQAALREILSTIPLFLLQGPPGVGKTYLVGDVVKRRLDDEPATRILLSAQSNSAIDHLMSEIQAIYRGDSPENRPMMVRARSMDDDESAGDFEIDVQAENLLQTLAASELVSEASPQLCGRIRELADARAKGRGRKGPSGLHGSRMSAELRAFEAMILRASNLVFATTNSYAVERLIEERGLFDWSIVEEAGKATGGELLSPLLLSHRRLMIGDHKQLPPFDFRKFKKLLAKTEDVRAVVDLLDDLISRFLREPGIDDLFREVKSGVEDFGRLCADTLDVLMLFETYVERELARQKKKSGGRNIGRRLTEQYRMHPWIARVVSDCFYEGDLTTNPEKQRRFLKGDAPFFSVDTKRLPDCPLTFIDMPYSREEGPGGRAGDRAPPWSNVDEVEAAVSALELLRVRDASRPASLAVLSPYWQQVKSLQQQFDRESDGRLKDLKAFLPAIDGPTYCGTVDSFQGGEADLVIVSLVRNNGHSTPAKALGFLTDDRRMNVLLSRAKWRLVLIGSLGFYKKIVELSTNIPDQPIGFLAKMIEVIESAERRKEARIVPWAQLKG